MPYINVMGHPDELRDIIIKQKKLNRDCVRLALKFSACKGFCLSDSFYSPYLVDTISLKLHNQAPVSSLSGHNPEERM